MSFANAVFSAVFVPSPPEPKLIPFCFLSGFPVGAWLLYALPSITYTGWRVIPFCPIWGDFRNHLLFFLCLNGPALGGAVPMLPLNPYLTLYCLIVQGIFCVAVDKVAW